MSAFIRYCFMGCLVLLISACSTAPKKPQPVDPNLANRLKNMSLPNRLPIPVEHVKNHQLKDTWAASRSNGRTHEGVDILAPKGTKVYSTTEGLVGSMKSNNLGGTVIWILGPGGAWHYYAHLDAHTRGLKEGDYVKKGQHIGYVGNTGNARHTAPHLHYGLYLSGRGRGAVNPYPYLR